MGDDRAMDDDRTVLPLPAAPDSIELRHLRAFVAVAEELNFARAAARLYLSSPALSRQIRVLERLVGADLLRRSTHHVELTLAGEALLDRARGVLADVDEAVARTRAVGGELSGRMARLWAPTADAGLDVAALRRAGEALHGQFAPPPEVQVRAANAGGVPALLVGADLDRPADLLYLHGGGYVSCSAFGYRPLVGALAAAAGATVLLPEYRLAPEHPFPAAVDDAVRAYRWLLEQGGRPEHVTVAGDSSGAGLTLSLLLTLAEQGEPMPGSAVLMCPLVDLTGAHVQDRAPDDATPVVTSALLRQLGGLSRGAPRRRPGRRPARRRPRRPAPAAGPGRHRGHRRRRGARAGAAGPRPRRRRHACSSTRPTPTSSTCSGRSCPRRARR